MCFLSIEGWCGLLTFITYIEGHTNNAIFGHHLNIGSLIGLLCDGLEEQIKSRVYFYKNSKLVGFNPHVLRS